MQKKSESSVNISIIINLCVREIRLYIILVCDAEVWSVSSEGVRRQPTQTVASRGQSVVRTVIKVVVCSVTKEYKCSRH